MGGINRVEDVAERIKVELEGKRYLLLLDNVKGNLVLSRIGIPQNIDGSKIVLTTRLGHICPSIMDQNVKVEKLSPDEAWNMFKNVLNCPNLSDNPNIKRFMHLVVKWCDGLPLMIRMTASAFKQRDTEESWSDGYKNLKKWLQRGDDESKEMYKSLSFCREYLDNDCQKNCFYYSALDDDGEWMRVTGRNVLERLKSVSLVEEGKHGKYVKLHKVIRQVALYNLRASTEHEYLVKASEALQKPPDVENWGKKEWISLVDNKLETLPDLPDCSLLSTLFLQKNSTLKIIPPKFFEKMEKLLVLDLHCTGITEIPLSLSWLKRLKVLYLNGCTSLAELPPEIGELQDLEVLDIRGSGVKDLPDQTKGLSRLRRLLLSFTSSGDEVKNQAAEFNRNVISKISDLKELVIDVESQQHLWNGMLNAIIENVHSWTKLATFQLCFLDGVVVDIKQVKDDTLKLCIPEEATLGSFVGKLDDFDSASFQVFIGCQISSYPRIPGFWKFKSYVKYCSGEGQQLRVSKLLAKAGALELVDHNDLEHLYSSPSGLNGIQGCLIESCNKIRRIVDCNITEDSPILLNLGLGPRVLPRLVDLILLDLPGLTSIWSDDSLEWPSLERLQVRGCPRLDKLPFSQQNAMKLRSIETEKDWWQALQWQTQEVKERFLPYHTDR
ncbi:hypothetical protein RJ639_024649 [Escallonia herrerae]|uniref:NB-ARC domain-containing protein n=1 Tax=Escallonia herrerae TaxID=1293975 RepID=A0AA88V1Y3_9ASTE|nr:hypothetical protein RJ639_024649 [Escallonia herrerae]